MLVPDWPVAANVKAVCTTRTGGVSGGTYASLNLGVHVGDALEDVQANRELLRQAIGVQPVFMQQVHGVDMTELQSSDVGRTDITADAAVTQAVGVACTVMVADCLPALICSPDGSVVAAAHAGWRGLAQGVLERTLARCAALAQLPVQEMHIWLGPCIGPTAFEVGSEVLDAYLAVDAQAIMHFAQQETGKYLANLPALARQRLARLGVQSVHGNDGSAAWCTVSQVAQFYSHRRDGSSGRFAALIWREVAPS